MFYKDLMVTIQMSLDCQNKKHSTAIWIIVTTWPQVSFLAGKKQRWRMWTDFSGFLFVSHLECLLTCLLFMLISRFSAFFEVILRLQLTIAWSFKFFEKLFDKGCLNQKVLEGRLGKSFVCCPSLNLPRWKEGWPVLQLDHPGRIKGRWDPCCSTEIANKIILDFKNIILFKNYWTN